MTRALRCALAAGSLLAFAGCAGAAAPPGATATATATTSSNPSPSSSTTAAPAASVACALLSEAAAATLTGDAAVKNTTNTRVTCAYAHGGNHATLQLQPLTGTALTALQSAVDSDGCSTASAPVTVLPDGAFEIIDHGCDALAFASGTLICNIEAATTVAAAAGNLEFGVETLADQVHAVLAGT